MTASYWNDFYSRISQNPDSRDYLFTQSSFAELVSEFCLKKMVILDFGAGTGRDSNFFATLGHEVISIDESSESLSLIDKSGIPNIQVYKADVTSKIALENLESKLRSNTIFLENQVVFYNRFFLHSLPNLGCGEFLTWIRRVAKKDDLFCSETRVDVTTSYEFGDHYRRPTSNSEVREILGLDFKSLLDVEDRGFSKIGEEDPLLGRLILRK